MIRLNGKLVRETRRAAILTLFVMLLPVLLVMLGFSVDMAYMQLVQTEMRLASDNVARVAADNLSRFEDEAQAIAAGVGVADDFTVAGKPLRLSASNFDFGRASAGVSGAFLFDTNGTPPNAVRVNAARNPTNPDGTVPLFFSRLVGSPEYSPEVSATAAFVNVDICLVLDRSTSMKFTVTSTESGMSTSDRRFCRAPPSNSRWAALDSAVKVFTSVLNNNTSDEQVSIVTFGSDINNVVPGLCGRLPAATVDMQLSTNLSAADGTINTLSNSVWNGNTEIASGILLGTQELTSARTRRLADKVMIVLTDGYPTAGDAVAAAAAAAAQKIVVYAITFGPDGDQNHMRNVAAAGRGEHAHAADEATLKEIFKRFAAKATILVQ
ncbi:MAG: VWA domain-containing protein [Pirellulaceae bacterium]|nr:VWA domain-containing protein [Pirellulaceae bacterium]